MIGRSILIKSLIKLKISADFIIFLFLWKIHSQFKFSLNLILNQFLRK